MRAAQHVQIMRAAPQLRFLSIVRAARSTYTSYIPQTALVATLNTNGLASFVYIFSRRVFQT
jgi:hypothetical protein